MGTACDGKQPASGPTVRNVKLQVCLKQWARLMSVSCGRWLWWLHDTQGPGEGVQCSGTEFTTVGMETVFT